MINYYARGVTTVVSVCFVSIAWHYNYIKLFIAAGGNTGEASGDILTIVSVRLLSCCVHC